jgi:hypothetical protein
VCGDYTIKLNRKTITPLIKKAYELYFGCEIGDQDKPWAPHIVCQLFSVFERMVERFSEVYAVCCSNGVARTKRSFDRQLSGISLKSEHSIQYPSLPSAVRLVLHSQDLPVPKPPKKWTTDDKPVPMEQDISDPDFQPSTSNEPHIIS